LIIDAIRGHLAGVFRPLVIGAIREHSAGVVRSLVIGAIREHSAGLVRPLVIDAIRGHLAGVVRIKHFALQQLRQRARILTHACKQHKGRWTFQTWLLVTTVAQGRKTQGMNLQL